MDILLGKDRFTILLACTHGCEPRECLPAGKNEDDALSDGGARPAPADCGPVAHDGSKQAVGAARSRPTGPRQASVEIPDPARCRAKVQLTRRTAYLRQADRHAGPARPVDLLRRPSEAAQSVATAGAEGSADGRSPAEASQICQSLQESDFESAGQVASTLAERVADGAERGEQHPDLRGAALFAAAGESDRPDKQGDGAAAQSNRLEEVAGRQCEQRG